MGGCVAFFFFPATSSPRSSFSPRSAPLLPSSRTCAQRAFRHTSPHTHTPPLLPPPIQQPRIPPLSNSIQSYPTLHHHSRPYAQTLLHHLSRPSPKHLPNPKPKRSPKFAIVSQEEGGEELPLEAALHCVLAAFRALQGPGRELQTDEGAFLSALYRRLPDLLRPESGDASGGGRRTASCVALVYDCLDAALGKRRELSTARVAAMIKRLLSFSLQMTQVGRGGAGGEGVWMYLCVAAGAPVRRGVPCENSTLLEVDGEMLAAVVGVRIILVSGLGAFFDGPRPSYPIYLPLLMMQ